MNPRHSLFSFQRACTLCFSTPVYISALLSQRPPVRVASIALRHFKLQAVEGGKQEGSVLCERENVLSLLAVNPAAPPPPCRTSSERVGALNSPHIRVPSVGNVFDFLIRASSKAANPGSHFVIAQQASGHFLMTSHKHTKRMDHLPLSCIEPSKHPGNKTTVLTQVSFVVAILQHLTWHGSRVHKSVSKIYLVRLSLTSKRA
jgi:hypothetical protein